MTDQELKQTLESLPFTSLDVRVEGRPGHLVAEVSSPDFEDQDEEVRQQKVWEHLVNKLSDEQRAEVEFVFTLAPGESEADPKA